MLQLIIRYLGKITCLISPQNGSGTCLAMCWGRRCSQQCIVFLEPNHRLLTFPRAARMKNGVQGAQCKLHQPTFSRLSLYIQNDFYFIRLPKVFTFLLFEKNRFFFNLLNITFFILSDYKTHQVMSLQMTRKKQQKAAVLLQTSTSKSAKAVVTTPDSVTRRAVHCAENWIPQGSLEGTAGAQAGTGLATVRSPSPRTQLRLGAKGLALLSSLCSAMFFCCPRQRQTLLVVTGTEWTVIPQPYYFSVGNPN